MNNQTLSNTPQDDDQISLYDILSFLKGCWSWLVGGLCLGLACEVAYLLVTPKQFEATAIVQLATVGMLPATTTTKGAEVEPLTQTLERVKLATFYTDDLLKTCQANSAAALAAKLSASQVKGNSLIQISYRAASGDMAKACVNAVVAKLANSQAVIAAPLIKALEEQIAMTQKQLGEAMSFQAQLEKRALTTADGESLLMLNALLKREEVLRLGKVLFDQKVQLTVPLTQPMQLLEPIYVPESAVSPKKLPAVAGGLFGGLVFGGLAFFVRRSWLARCA